MKLIWNFPGSEGVQNKNLPWGYGYSLELHIIYGTANFPVDVKGPGGSDLNIQWTLCTYQCKPRGGGVRARGGDLTKEQKFWSISRGWGSIRSSNVVKNPHLDISFQKHKLKSEYMPLL